MTREEINDRFQSAVGILVEEPGDIKERLLVAYISQLSVIPVPADLPGDLSAEFDSISFELDSDGRRGDEGTVSKELKQLSVEEATHLARRLYNIFLALHDFKGADDDTGSDT